MKHEFRSSAGRSARKALLVVEDDPIVREAVVFVLVNDEYDVIAVESGEDGLSVITHKSFEGLYTDINLGGSVTGWEVGRAFNQRWPTKPIVFASAAELPVSPLIPGAVFLRKPFLLSQLISKLQPSVE